MREKIEKIFKKYHFDINDEQIDKFELYYKFLIAENEKYNLTNIVDEDEVILKHFLDSVFPIKELKENASLVDVGSGAGFPGVPIKILRPDIDIVLVDSLQKRVNFLNELIKLLKLEKITAVHARVEDFAIKNKEKFDYALSRAVAKINTLSEYLIPLVKTNGKVIMYKSQKLEEELKEGQKAIKLLGGKVQSVLNFEIDEIQSFRALLIIDKISPTPRQYPRDKNLPKTKPII